MIKTSIIVAVADNGVIGKNGGMAWHLPSEMKYFKSTTIGKPVIHGRKSFEDLGKPLPNRPNIVLTRRQDFKYPGVLVAHSLPEAEILAKKEAERLGVDEIFVAGGAEIYAESLKTADRLYYTEIHGQPEGNTRFPAFDRNQWREVRRELKVMRPEEDFDYTITILERKL
jgi:dihydrofolate reductase